MDLTRLTRGFADDVTPLIRTDFTNDDAWRATIAAATRPVDFENPDNQNPGDDGYAPNLDPVDDPVFTAITGKELAEGFAPTDECYGYVLLADERTMAEAAGTGELTLDYVDLSVTADDDEDPGAILGRTFRCAIPELASIEANLSISNMDFHEFADRTDPDGVFRGFPGSWTGKRGMVHLVRPSA